MFTTWTQKPESLGYAVPFSFSDLFSVSRFSEKHKILIPTDWLGTCTLDQIKVERRQSTNFT